MRRQSATSVRTPPTRTPIAAPAPPTAPQAASAFARCLPWKAVVMIESAAGESIAAPRPWPARAANSAAAVPASAEATDETVKTPRPVRNMRRRPTQVGEPAAEEQQAAEDERVARDRPADRRSTQLQIPGEARQGDVHGRDVENHHQLGDQQNAEENGTASAGGRLGLTGSVFVAVAGGRRHCCGRGRCLSVMHGPDPLQDGRGSVAMSGHFRLLLGGFRV